MGLGGGDPIFVDTSALVSLRAAGIPTSAILASDNSTKSILYKGIDRLRVPIEDTDPLSLEYLRITYLPDEFNLGKNLIRIRPDITLFKENSQLFVEIIDYNGDPIYHEIEINSETKDTFIIISVHIYEDTPPGPCLVYIGGTLKDTPIPAANTVYPINFRWKTVVNIDTSELTKSPIIYTTLPEINLTSLTASYDLLTYPGGRQLTSSTYYNLQLSNGYAVPSITPINQNDSFSASMSTGIMYVNYEDIQLINPPRFLSNTLLGYGVTASIDQFITSKSLTLEESIVIYQQGLHSPLILKNAIFRTASISYLQDPDGVIVSGLQKRILTVDFDNLDPFTGQIRNIKAFYRNTALKTTEYLPLNDFVIQTGSVDQGFNINSGSYSLLLPDSEIDERYDIRFEFFNNEEVPSKQVLNIYDIFVAGTAPVITNNIGIVMLNPSTSTLDGKNMVRTLWQDFDTRCVHTTSFRELTGKVCVSKSITDFTAFIPDGASYVTTYYNMSFINLTKQTQPQDIGLYAYTTNMSVYTMSTASYTEFAYPEDETSTLIASSDATYYLSSDYNANHTAYGYPVKHVLTLPEQNKLYRFKLTHKLEIPTSGSAVPGFVSFVPDGINTDPSGSWLIAGTTISNISSGVLTLTLNANQGNYIRQDLSTNIFPGTLTIGKNYKLVVTVDQYTAPGVGGTLNFSLGTISGTSPYGYTLPSAAGTYEVTLTPFSADNKINLQYSAGDGGAATFKLSNISLTLLNDSSASFAASASIKDIDIVSSGYLFISGARSTYVSGSYSYYVPSS